MLRFNPPNTPADDLFDISVKFEACRYNWKTDWDLSGCMEEAGLKICPEFDPGNILDDEDKIKKCKDTAEAAFKAKLDKVPELMAVHDAYIACMYKEVVAEDGETDLQRPPFVDGDPERLMSSFCKHNAVNSFNVLLSAAPTAPAPAPVFFTKNNVSLRPTTKFITIMM